MRRILFLIIVGFGGAAILIALGTWQVQRLGWKQDLLASIADRIDSPPMSLEAAIAPTFMRYQAVSIEGEFGAPYLRILASRKTTGAVYRIVRPFDVTGFGTILVDTGWQPQSRSVGPAPEGSVSLVGNLNAPNEIDSFTPEPDLDENIWFARDVPAMAEALGTQPVMVVLRDEPSVDLGVTPWPVDTRDIPNDHLQYAITWFSLAVLWLLMSLYFFRRGMRNDPVDPTP